MKFSSSVCFCCALALALVVTGCGSAADTVGDVKPDGDHVAMRSDPPREFPAIYEGELPCDDCQGVFYQLELFEDGVFFLRTTKIGHAVGAVTDVVGSWESVLGYKPFQNHTVTDVLTLVFMEKTNSAS